MYHLSTPFEIKTTLSYCVVKVIDVVMSSSIVSAGSASITRSPLPLPVLIKTYSLPAFDAASGNVTVTSLAVAAYENSTK